MIEPKFIQRIAEEAGVKPAQVETAIQFFDKGATIPFIARYRKDVTGNLDEVKLERIAERGEYFAALASRRAFVLDAIAKQDKLTEELRAKIESCYDKTTLEELYLPYKKERRTKATVAREKGLAPLADFIWAQVPGEQGIEEYAATFVKAEKAIAAVQEALDGALHILIEIVNTDIEARAHIRERMWKEGRVASCSTKNAEGKKTKFEAYYHFEELAAKIPSHRLLAILRGVREGVLRMDLKLNDEALQAELTARYLKAPGTAFEPYVRQAVEDAYKRHLRPSLEGEVTGLAREQADEEAIHVFRENAQNLLLAPPAGRIAVVGVDPGIRTGCKLAVIDNTGKFLESATVYPHPPQNAAEDAEKVLLALMQKHEARAVAIGNGTGARETAAFVRGALSKVEGRQFFSVFVNEAGASVYSASKIAREEFPDLDITIRGAISIARRLQDPLAELVKTEPRSIGVGQYQHDVNQKSLREGLHRTVISCVNKVGVDLNTASAALLRYVSGIQSDTANNIVEFRTRNGGFKSRGQLLEVNGVGPRVFEQSAGFLRVTGENPLDATAIHPEAYPVVEKIAETLNVPVTALIENPEVLTTINIEAFADGSIGLLTLKDIRNELMKPGRDPRREFKIPKFTEGVNSVADLQDGMELEGVVTNVTDFGAFVDVGVHQDGLVHLSELANRFVQEAHDVVRVGDIVRVKVLKVDKALPRISLSIRALLPPPEKKPRHDRPQQKPKPPQTARQETGEGGQDRTHRLAADGRGQDRQSHAPRRDQKPPAQRDARPDRQERPDRPMRRERPARRDAQQTRPHHEAGRDAGGPSTDAGKPHKDKPGKPLTRQENKGGMLNTLLADQLAALRDKFGA